MRAKNLTPEQRRQIARQAHALEAQCRALLDHPAARATLTGERRRKHNTNLIPAAIDAMEQAAPERSDDVDQAHRLWAQAEALRHQLVACLGWAVKKVAGEWMGVQGHLLAREDLEQEGWVGAVFAARLWDPDAKGSASLVSYSKWWIRARISRIVQVEGRTVRLPTGLNEQHHLIRRARDELGSDATDQAVADLIGLRAERVTSIRKAVQHIARLDATIDQKEDTRTLYDLIPADDIDRDEQYAGDIDTDRYAKLIRRYCAYRKNERNVRMMMKRYGLEGEGARTCASLGKEFGLSRERVRQILIVQEEALKEWLQHQVNKRRRAG
ncbi:MAG: hypothetical protein AAFV53_21025 [Myxococcota bacterium]